MSESFYFDRASNVILYPGVPIPALKAAGLTCHEFGDKAFAVPRTLKDLRVLSYYNYAVPPIMDEESYDWPIEPGKKPLAHQKIYANFSLLHPRMFNLGDAGSMKTLSTLWAMDYLMKQEPGLKALII